MLKIPYGISDYKKLIMEGYYYVDKTMYLEKLENIGDVLVYLRPGRFGKTLFTSMMYCYYDINSKSEFNSLFKDTYVMNNPTKNKNNYYILKFDFSGITSASMGKEDLEKEFMAKVVSGINKFNTNYRFEFDTDCTGYTPNRFLIKFFDYVETLNLENKLYIIIDEYDNFTNAILEGSGDRFKDIVGNEGFLKGFYAVIKEFCGKLVDRVFITGICPITLDSMTTGFNISTDISRDIEFNSMIGLTHEEVKYLIKDIEQEKQEGIFNLMINNYDGYLFSKETESKVFNATLVMYFMKEYNRFLKEPTNLLDTNIAFNYGKVENILKLQNNDFYKEIIDTIFKNGTVSGELKPKFNLSIDFEKNDIISLLYYFGYLTIDKKEIYDDDTIFKIPNYVINETYHNYFQKLLRDIKIDIDSSIVRDAVKEMANDGKIDKLTNYVSKILKKSDNRIFMKFDERYIQTVYFTLLISNRLFNSYNEYPCSNGYIDLIFFSNSELCKYDIMIELKYLKVKEYRRNRKLLNIKKIDAINQLKSYEDDERIDKTNLRKYVVIFVGHDLKVLEEVL